MNYANWRTCELCQISVDLFEALSGRSGSNNQDVLVKSLQVFMACLEQLDHIGLIDSNEKAILEKEEELFQQIKSMTIGWFKKIFHGKMVHFTKPGFLQLQFPLELQVRFR